MSERPKGDPIANLDAFIAGANDVVEDEVADTSEAVVMPDRLNKKRRHPPKKPGDLKEEEKPKEDLRGYGVDVLKDQLVEDTELKKMGKWLDNDLKRVPKRKIEVEIAEDSLKNDEVVDIVQPVEIKEAENEEDHVFSDVAIEPNSRRSKTPFAIVDAEILNEDGSTEDPKKEADTGNEFTGFNRNVQGGRKLRRRIADLRVKNEEKVVVAAKDLTPKNQNVTEVESQDKTEIKTEAPKKEKPKSAVELAMEKTQIVADEYNEKKLKKEDIAKAKYIDDLLAAIDSSEGLQGSREYFDKGKLRMIVEMVRDGKLGYEYLTRSGGLRQKVFDILNKPKKVEKPKAEQPIEEPVEIEKEFVVEDAEQITLLPEDKTSDKVLKFEKKNKRVGITKEGVSPMLIEDVELNKQIRVQEREVGRLRRDYFFAFKKYQNDFNKFNEAGPFKRFWMKITSAGERLNDSGAYFEQMKTSYRKQIDSLVDQKTELKFAEISSLRANSPERRKYGKVTNADLINFINTRINKPLPEKFKNLSDQERWMPIDMKQIVAENILSKKEAGDLTEEIIKLEIKKEIAGEVVRDEKEVLDRKLAE